MNKSLQYSWNYTFEGWWILKSVKRAKKYVLWTSIKLCCQIRHPFINCFDFIFSSFFFFVFWMKTLILIYWMKFRPMADIWHWVNYYKNATSVFFFRPIVLHNNSKTNQFVVRVYNTNPIKRTSNLNIWYFFFYTFCTLTKRLPSMSWIKGEGNLNHNGSIMCLPAQPFLIRA